MVSQPNLIGLNISYGFSDYDLNIICQNLYFFWCCTIVVTITCILTIQKDLLTQFVWICCQEIIRPMPATIIRSVILFMYFRPENSVVHLDADWDAINVKSVLNSSKAVLMLNVPAKCVFLSLCVYASPEAKPIDTLNCNVRKWGIPHYYHGRRHVCNHCFSNVCME